MDRNKLAVWGGIGAFAAVALGAFGAHGLEGKLTADMLKVYQTGVQYQMYHSLGLLLLALMADRLVPPTTARWAGRLFIAGIVLFSGSLYALSLSGAKILGAITPLGGVAFLAGWAMLAWGARKNR